ncbi:hypothetical protein [Nonomuraea sp. NPDC003201]
MRDSSEGRADEQLLAELTAALSAKRQVPPDVVEAGKAVFGWRAFDAEVARLVLESDELIGSALSRAEPASLSTLTFQSAQLLIELESVDDALIGQLVPEQAARIEVRTLTGAVREVTADEVGGFTVRPTPRGAFHLLVYTVSGLKVCTSWVSI